MKNLSLFVSAAALLSASSAFAAINCATLPSCADLGYTDKVADCPSASEVLKCPFDTSLGKCARGPSIGDLKYSIGTMGDHNGWLLCDGRQFSSDSTAKYYKLYQVIKTNFCHKYTSASDNSSTSNCQAGMFALPDYRGFFLRAATKSVTATSTVPTVSSGTSGTRSYSTALDFMGGTPNGSYVNPQKEELPNIAGTFTATMTKWEEINHPLFASRSQTTNNGDNSTNFGLAKDSRGYAHQGRIYTFDASKSNTIYNGSHVIPANYAAYVFIYAGK